jgi:hypothetical protein
MTEVMTENLITKEVMTEDIMETERETIIMVDMIAIVEEEAMEGIMRTEATVVHHMEAKEKEVPHAEDQFLKGMKQIDLLRNVCL